MTDVTETLRLRMFLEAIQTPEFSALLSAAVEQVKQVASPNANEATVAGAFERILYHLLANVNYNFSPVKEELVDVIRHMGRGRTDSRLEAVIIEYKRPS